MRAREQRRAPGRELIGLEAARKQDRVPARASELALQLTLTQGGHRPHGAKAEQVQAFELLLIERQLVR